MKFLSFLLTLLLLLPSLPVRAEEDTRFQDAEKYFQEQNIIQGSFQNLDAPISKVDFLKLALENIGYSPDATLHFTPTPYKDVLPKEWYASYVQKASRIGILAKGDNFFPSASLRRVDAFRLVLQLEGYTIPKIYKQDVSSYKDLRTEEEKQVAAKILDLQVYTPLSENFFGAQGYITRKEALETLYTFTLISEGEDKVTTIPSVVITSKSSLPGVEYLEDIRSQLQQKYYQPDKLKDDDLIQGAMQGMTKAVGDKYTVYFPPSDSRNFTDTLDGSFEGIGAYLEENDDGVIIQTPIKGSPAEKAGVKSGDVIKKVDGVSTEGMSSENIVKLIKGPKGSSVTIEFSRKGTPITLTIVRDKIDIKSITTEIRNNVLIITMNQFGSTTATEFSDAITNNYTSNLQGIVLDLRSNPGGFLTTAEQILSYWVEENAPIVNLKYKTSTDTVTSMKNQKLTNVKTAILINKGSASASEIVAGTMKDYGKAKLFGETSFGKGSVQELISYRNGGMLKVTVAEWFTGKNNSINHIGVKPDVEIHNDKNSTEDAVLQSALNWINQY